MQIQETWNGRGAEFSVVFKQGFFPHFQRDQACTALDGAVLAIDFHLEDFIGVLPGLDPGMGHESNQAFLKSAKTAFDFTFGLRSGRDEVGHTKSKQGALELAFWITAVVGGAWTEEAQPVGIDSFRQPMGFESAAEVAEVIPGSLSRDETARNIEAGMIIDGEE